MFSEKIEKIPVIQVHIYKQSGKVWTNLGGWIERNIDLNVDGWIERNINFNVQFQSLAEHLKFSEKLENSL